jgi:hypothetical protein
MCVMLRISVGTPRIELESHAPEACILPLYYVPTLVRSHATRVSAICSRSTHGRGAETRTRVTRTPCAHTTPVLHPDRM